ncbi:MAG: two-component system, response regulator, stage 0 sporulation protein [Moorella sp. (in: firmicutes)]|nr:two-component system, response regulator, stage 0 sporulation protein [Moorella sp. (in: firmicutes)]
MVIDDQPGVRRLICEALRQLGYSLCVASEGREALEKIASEAPDLVILDIKMPSMNGVEFLKELRKLSVATPVIIITAYNELDLVEQASEFGARYVLQKPFDIKQLYRLVQAALQPE